MIELGRENNLLKIITDTGAYLVNIKEISFIKLGEIKEVKDNKIATLHFNMVNKEGVTLNILKEDVVILNEFIKKHM